MTNEALKDYLLETLEAVETLARSFRSSLEGRPTADGKRVIDANEVKAQLAASEAALGDIAKRLKGAA